MALLKCEDCGREVSSKAAACPNCGCPVPSSDSHAKAIQSGMAPGAAEKHARAPTPIVAPPVARSSPAKPIIWVIVIFVAYFAIRGCSDGSTRTSKESAANPPSTQTQVAKPAKPAGPGEADMKRWAAQLEDEGATVFVREKAARELIRNFPESPSGKKASALIDKLAEEVAYEKAGGQWSYNTTAEGMSDKDIRYARVMSTNTISLDFPYAGPQHGTLTFRRHPRWGNDVVLSIEKGQILCHSYGDCYVGVRFDDERLLRYKGNPPEDNSTEVVFIPAFSTFMKKLPKAKKVRVEIQIYQEGNHVFEFDVSGFKPEKFK